MPPLHVTRSIGPNPLSCMHPASSCWDTQSPYELLLCAPLLSIAASGHAHPSPSAPGQVIGVWASSYPVGQPSPRGTWYIYELNNNAHVAKVVKLYTIIACVTACSFQLFNTYSVSDLLCLMLTSDIVARMKEHTESPRTTDCTIRCQVLDSKKVFVFLNMLIRKSLYS